MIIYMIIYDYICILYSLKMFDIVQIFDSRLEFVCVLQQTRNLACIEAQGCQDVYGHV